MAALEEKQMVEQVKGLKTDIKYKDTPIGKIPVDWEITSLGKIAYFEYGESLPERKREKGEIPVYGSNGLIGYHNQSLVDGSGIVIGRKGSVGVVTWVDNKFWPIDTTYYISVKQTKEDFKWLFYLLSNSHLEELNAATGVPGLNRDIALAKIVPCPSLTEQKRIAEILSTVDDAIEKTDQIIEKMKEAKKGLMQKLLTRGIGHTRFKKTEIGEIPEEWEVVRLKNIALKFYNGGTPDTANKTYWDGNVPWITGADFENQKVGKIRRYVTQEGVKNSATNVIPKGNLLIVTRTGVGKLAIAPFDLAISQDITGVILDSAKTITWFVYWYLNYNESRLRAIIQGTSINGLLREDLETFAIPLPPPSEQQQIADILSSLDSQIEQETRHKEQLESLKKGLMQVLLTGKIRVKMLG
ncbi:MAG: restriction endonuclease subunit S [Proteobacteria bacterium]|nr:restriction endonuclease subunit S [Pseudomonadota bacterium]